MHFPFSCLLFSCLGVFIGTPSGLYPPIRDLALGDSSLSLVLGEL